MNYPKTYAAAKRAEHGQWAIGDALLEEIGPPRQGSAQQERFRDCAAELARAGLVYSVDRLLMLRNLAHKFVATSVSGDRGVTVEVAREAGTPGLLAKATAMAESDDVSLTKRYVANVRKASAKQKKDAPRGAGDAPKETQRTIVAMELQAMPQMAARLGREFVAMLAGADVTDDEREQLSADIVQALDTWKAAGDAVVNPLGDEIDQFLEDRA